MFSEFCKRCGCSPCRCAGRSGCGCCVGPTGATGPRGPIGPQGDVGPTGPTGPSAVTVRVGQTVTGQPGTQASVTDTGGTDPILTFTIPQGATGPVVQGVAVADVATTADAETLANKINELLTSLRDADIIET